MGYNLEKFLIYSIVISLLLVGTASSFIVYLRPPKMFIRMSVTPGEYSFSDAVLEVKNLNNKTVTVEFIPRENFENMVIFETDKKFELEPDEGLNFTFKIKADQPGIYNETMGVNYEMEGQNPVALESDITIIAQEVELENGKNDISKYIIGFILLVIIILVLFVFLRGGVNK